MVRKHDFQGPRPSPNGPKIDKKSILSAVYIEVLFRHPLAAPVDRSQGPLGKIFQHKIKFWDPKLAPKLGPNFSKIVS